MLAKIIQWSGRNPFLVLLATLFIVIAGGVAVMRTPLDALPDLSDVQVIVYTEYHNKRPNATTPPSTIPTVLKSKACTSVSSEDLRKAFIAT